MGYLPNFTGGIRGRMAEEISASQYRGSFQSKHVPMYTHTHNQLFKWSSLKVIIKRDYTSLHNGL